MKECRGTITIFFSMMLSVAIAFTAAVLEVSKYEYTLGMLTMISDSAAESLYAGFDKKLWENYGLILYPYNEYSKDQMDEYIGYYIDDMGAMLGINSYEVEFDGHIFFDEAYFMEQVEALSGTEIGEYDNRYKDCFKDALINSKEYRELARGLTEEGDSSEGEKKEIIDVLKKIVYQRENLLNEAAAKLGLSTKELENSEEDRKLSDSGETVHNSIDLKGISGYVQRFLKNYIDDGDGALSYETEYVIYGRNADSENMLLCADEILSIREGINYKLLKSDEKLSNSIFEYAEYLADAEETTVYWEQVLGAVWVFGQSVNDVCNILSGNSVSADGYVVLDIIDACREQWTAEYDFNGGIVYDDFLNYFISEGSNEDILSRVINIIDLNMQKYEESFKLNSCIVGMNIKLKYDISIGFAGENVDSSIVNRIIRGYDVEKCVSIKY